MKKLVASLLVASMALGLTACGGSSDSTASTGESTGTAAGTEAAATAEATTTNAETNVLNINLASEPDYLDPALNSSVDGGCLAVNSSQVFIPMIRMVILSRHSQPICRKYLRTELSTPFT